MIESTAKLSEAGHERIADVLDSFRATIDEDGLAFLGDPPLQSAERKILVGELNRLAKHHRGQLQLGSS